MEIINLLNETKNAIVYAYLCKAKKDYPYNIAKNFQIAIKRKIWNKKSLKVNYYLKDPSQLSVVLKDLKENQLLFSQILQKNGRNRIYYSINPQVFVNKHLYLYDLMEKYNINKFSFHPFLQLLKYYYNFHSEEISELDIIRCLNRWNQFNFTMLLRFNYENLNEIKKRNKLINFLRDYFYLYWDHVNLSSLRTIPLSINEYLTVIIPADLYESLQNLKKSKWVRKNGKLKRIIEN